ncbi:PKD domain-containing protein [Ulvibacterium marinum]|uniref:PKD domain-containing protein n=1 Tax=Ulvibacterium marinum TaxID=2419782 RepID=UPI0024950C70|nr:PKD domain-containing protein [Ulvibacterium marinum]
MTPNLQSVKILLASTILFLSFSCQKDETSPESVATQKLPIKIVGTSLISGNGDLIITNERGRRTTHYGLKYGETQEIETVLSVEGKYTFEIEDANLGRIKMYASREALLSYTPEAPFTLEFEHYKNQKIATFNVKSEIGPDLRDRRIDLIVIQGYESLYHIDWGDGTEEVTEAPAERRTGNDPVSHKYAVSGEYTITLSTTNREEVTGLELQYTANGNGDRIQNLELENLPNLTYLSLGDSDMPYVDSIIENYPDLTNLSLRFGALNSIDLSKNPKLELLIITGNYDTSIKGLSALTNLKNLGITGDIENLDLSLYPELTSLVIRGHDFTTLDLATNPKLANLGLQLNNLEQIDISTNVELKTLSIMNNNLTELNISNNPQIEYLNLYANYINELDISQQDQLEFLNLSSVHLKQVTAPESLDAIKSIDLTLARLLNETELLDAVFKGQENNPKTNGEIIFHKLAYVIERQIAPLNQLVSEHDWRINVPQ